MKSLWQYWTQCGPLSDGDMRRGPGSVIKQKNAVIILMLDQDKYLFKEKLAPAQFLRRSFILIIVRKVPTKMQNCIQIV